MDLNSTATLKQPRPVAGDSSSTYAWFCVRSQPKHEQIAARHLRQIEKIEVFNPCIRFARPTKTGPQWVTESLFPNYLFVRFDWTTCLPRVHYSPGVAGVVHFGSRWPAVPDQTIEELRASLGPEEVHIIPKDFQPGEKIQIAGGMFHGLSAVIAQVMPGKDRVLVLMDFLGRQSTVEVSVTSVVKNITR